MSHRRTTHGACDLVQDGKVLCKVHYSLVAYGTYFVHDWRGCICGPAEIIRRISFAPFKLALQVGPDLLMRLTPLQVDLDSGIAHVVVSVPDRGT